MIKLKTEQFVVLACLADYNFNIYEIIDFASELTYDISIENTINVVQELLDLALIQERNITYSNVTFTELEKPHIVHPLQEYEISPMGQTILLSEMKHVDLLIKRIRKQVRQLT